MSFDRDNVVDALFSSLKEVLHFDVPEHSEILAKGGHVLHLTPLNLRTLKQGEPSVGVDRR